MSKEQDQKTNNSVEVEAFNVSVTLSHGSKTASSAHIDLLQGRNSLFVEHTSGSGTLKVDLMETALIDESMMSWTLKPGQSINYFDMKTPKRDTFYLKLTAPDRNAGGKGTLGQPYIV